MIDMWLAEEAIRETQRRIGRAELVRQSLSPPAERHRPAPRRWLARTLVQAGLHLDPEALPVAAIRVTA